MQALFATKYVRAILCIGDHPGMQQGKWLNQCCHNRAPFRAVRSQCPKCCHRYKVCIGHVNNFWPILLPLRVSSQHLVGSLFHDYTVREFWLYLLWTSGRPEVESIVFGCCSVPSFQDQHSCAGSHAMGHANWQETAVQSFVLSVCGNVHPCSQVTYKTCFKNGYKSFYGIEQFQP